MERLRLREIALFPKQDGEAVEASGRHRVFRAKCLLVDRKNTLVERARTRKITLFQNHKREVAETDRYVGMLRTQRAFAPGNCIAK